MTDERTDGWFRWFAHRVSEAAGSHRAFIAALAVVLIWAVTGPVFHFSDSWQLVINTGTTGAAVRKAAAELKKG